VGAFDADRVALLSIRPEFARAIFAGQKTVEFRRSRLPNDITTVVVYATQPIGLVLGWFTIAGISESTPEGLWRRFRLSGAIGRRAYFDYFDGAVRAFGIEIEEATPLKRPVSLDELLPGLRPPQSFQYLATDEVWRAIRTSGAGRRTRARLRAALAF
jgi:predicted transcriptional regulator